MNTHFGSFTADAMRGLGEGLAADARQRAEFLESARQHTQGLLQGSRRDHQETEKGRRERAESEADARRLFMSELRSDVHALLGRFELSRKEMAGDLREMASELHAACDAFRARSGAAGRR